MRRRVLLALLLLLGLALWGPTLWSPAAHAVEPHEMLDDPQLEARARDLSTIIRCLVCQNQSIDESDAELAADLRVIVRERLTAGDSDQAVLDYLVDRYGAFVLLRPPMTPETYVLYFGPIGFLAIALAAAALYFRRRRAPAAKAGENRLTGDEQARLERILKQDGTEK